MQPPPKEGGGTTIAKDGITIIVPASSGIIQLTIKQVKQIYNGSITNWATLGGVSHTINVYNRESGSGTRGTFEDLVMKSDSS
nr:substrate-binding domain-containing protein [Candidatus Sigynarchaeota archaeon]